MTSLTDTQVVTASGGLVELGYAESNSNTTITSTTAGSGDTVISALTVVCDGSPIVVEFFAPQVRPQPSANCEMNISLYEDGVEETRQWGRFYNGAGNFDNKPAQLTRRLTPSAGSHTYSVKAYVNSGSGSVGGGSSGGTGSAPCYLRVSKIVQATQWPAVTTGTIICTSSTRPASPFEGQTIYETDTKKQLTYDGAGWYPPWNQPWGVVGVGTHDTGTAVSTGVSICSVTFTAVANRQYLCSYVSRTIWSGGSATVGIYDNTTSLRIAEDYGAPNPVVLQRAKSFPAGSRTLSVRQDGATSMTPISGSYSGNERPAQLVVRDIGPA